MGSQEVRGRGIWAMRVSIALATFNGSAFLSQQLESFLAQTRIPDELVVSDDNSSDETVEILNAFCASAPFEVHVHQNQRTIGYTQNFSRALEMCRGNIVLLSDQDDVWLENKVSEIEKAFCSMPDLAALVHDGQLVDEHLNWTGLTKRGQIISGFGDDGQLATGALSAFRGSFLRTALPVPIGIQGHDRWLHHLARLCDRRWVLPETLQMIRRHGDNSSAWLASSLEPITSKEVFIAQARSKTAQSYSDRIFENSALLKLFESDAFSAELGLNTHTVQKALEFLVDERVSLTRRQELISKGHLGRKICAVKLLLSGGYKHFNGFHSFARDVVR